MAYVVPTTFTAGSVLTAAQMNVIGADLVDHELYVSPLRSAWTSLTPTWTGVTIGNGSTSARYMQTGKTVTYTGRLDIGSTTSFSATLTVSSPVTMQSPNYHIGAAVIVDSGTRAYPGVIKPATSTTFNFGHNGTGNFGEVNGTNPFTLGANDYIYWTVTFEAA
ncbi:MAG: hypothetical protein WCG15_00530 [Actinomycetes bacterium]